MRGCLHCHYDGNGNAIFVYLTEFSADWLIG